MSNAIFISYRRSVSGHLSLALNQFLADAGVDTFFDIDSIRAGEFDTIVRNQISARPYFMPVLSHGTLDRCVDPDDWVRKEIEHALAAGRTIVPVTTHEFERDDIDRFLPAEVATELRRWNAVGIPKSLRQFKYAAQDLVDNFFVPITDVPLAPTPPDDEQAVADTATQTVNAPAVTDELLDADEHFERGLKLQHQGQLEASIEEYDRVLALDSANVIARLSRAIAYGQTGDMARAKAEHDLTFRMDHTAVTLRAFFEGAIARDPSNSWLYVSLGLALGEIGDLDAAMANFTTAIELDPTNETAIFNRGATFEEFGNIEAAIADFSRTIELSPDAYAHAARGSCRAILGDIDGANLDFDTAILMDPENAWIYSFRGDVHLENDDLDLAIADYDMAIDRDPANPRHYSARGTAHQCLDDLEAAVADFDRAIELDPTDAYAYRSRGEVRMDGDDLNGAISDFGRAIDADPSNDKAYAHYLRGIARLDLGDTRGAATDLRIADALAAALDEPDLQADIRDALGEVDAET